MENYIGVKIKKIRLQNEMTQQKVADQCGLSKGMISKIECGKVIPTIATLSKIAHALRVKVSLLMEDSESRTPVFQSTNVSRMHFTRVEVGYRFLTLASEYGNKIIQPLIFYAKKGEVKEHRVTHQGEECIYVIEGDMWFMVNDIRYYLRAGDFLYFDGQHPHGIESVDKEVRYLNIFSATEYVNKTFVDKENDNGSKYA
jgi:transcriptional regulator with XRE-family HTH domain